MSRLGKILIAHPLLRLDNPFHKTIIYMYQDEPKQGSVGVVLNRQSSIPLKEIAEDKGIMWPSQMECLYRGGPVNQGALVLLHTDDWESQNTALAGGYRVSSDDFMLEKLANGNVPVYWRLMTGFCAWAPGQLDAEINGSFPYRLENTWLTIPANDSIMFEYSGEEQWSKAVKLATKQMVNQYF